MPAHALRFAPPGHLSVAVVGEAIARLLMRMHSGERGLRPQCVQDLRDLAGVDFNATAPPLQFGIQGDQRFADEAEMLKRGIRLSPQVRLDDVNAPNLSQSGGLRQGGVVMPAQVSLEPNQFIAHGMGHHKRLRSGPGQAIAVRTDRLMLATARASQTARLRGVCIPG